MNEVEGNDLPEILSTHPASDKRAHDLELLMPMVCIYKLKRKKNIFYSKIFKFFSSQI